MTALDPRPLLRSRPRRILVACDELEVAGGLLRFERTGAVLRRHGHEVALARLSDRSAPPRHTPLPVLTFAEAQQSGWDAVMVPGAGFPDEVIAKFAMFRNEQFGVRVQHFLNDQSRRAAFKRVNTHLSPHLVVINNLAWPVGSYSEFTAERFHVLLGAVDFERFREGVRLREARPSDEWIIGGLAGKNPEPLIESLPLLGKGAKLRLFGPLPAELRRRYARLVDTGRIELPGTLAEDALPAFYAGVDCVAMTELHAGWSNLVAEAMASGVPVVCTGHGTVAFAFNQETALVVDTPTPACLASAINALWRDVQLAEKLRAAASRVISQYTWEKYAAGLLELIDNYGDGSSLRGQNSRSSIFSERQRMR